MSKGIRLALVGLLAVVVAIVVLYSRRDAPRPSTATSDSNMAAAQKAAPASAPGASTPEIADPPARRPRARRLADPRQRDQLLEAIRQARESRRTTAASRSATSRSDDAVEESDVPSDEAEYIRESVRAIVPLLMECYEQALERAPKLGGKIVVDFSIEGEPEIGGIIGASEIADGTTIEDEELRECISETMYAIEIDPPANGGTIHVTYPFEFRSEPPADE